jgi:formiminotetrahydrofolate cyclodeaminase
VAFADRTLAELLDRLAAREPAPGGGSAAAMAGASAAALVEMAAAFALSKLEGLRARATELRARQLQLAEEDLCSYQPVLDAMALDPGDAGRGARLAAALSAAADVPLAIAAAAAETAELAATVAEAGSEHLVGDATAAVVLAEAGSRAAIALVELNLAQAREDPRLAVAAELAARAWAARATTLELSRRMRRTRDSAARP